MRQYNKQPTNSLKRLSIQLTILAIVFSSLLFAAYRLTKKTRTNEHEYVSMAIGTIDKPTSYEIVIQYKDKPVGIKVISPTGTVYDTYTIDSDNTRYSYTDDGSAITINMDTADYGDWVLNYNHAHHNKNLKINIQEEPYNGLCPIDIKATIVNEKLLLQFMPYAKNGNEKTTVKYYILGYPDGSSSNGYGVPDNKMHEILTNELVTDTYDVTDEFLSGKHPTIRLVTYQSECNASDNYYSNTIIKDIEPEISEDD